MAKIKIATFDDRESASGDVFVAPATEGVRTETVFGGSGDPIHTHLHRLRPGTGIEWPGSRFGYLAYVWSGVAEVRSVQLAAGSAIVVEHAAPIAISAGPAGCDLLIIGRNPRSDDVPTRSGGRAHLLPAERVARTDRLYDGINYGAAIFADAGCPTCSLWLHESRFFDPDYLVAPHYHNEDEVIVVTQGEIVLGKRTYARGTVIAIARGTIYSFRTGPEGLTFLNFRSSQPTYTKAGTQQGVDEQSAYVGKLGRPQYIDGTVSW